MRIVVVDNEVGVLTEAVLNSLGMSDDRLFSLDSEALMNYEPDNQDVIFIYVDDLNKLSTAFSMINLLIHGVIRHATFITSLDLSEPFKLADRWEELRIDELRAEGRFQVLSSASGWRNRVKATVSHLCGDPQ